MALSETDNSDCNSDSSVDGNVNKERKEKHLTKIVVRRLPPSMNKETFLNQISPIPDYDYLSFVRADMSLGEYAYSRAYINFKNATDIFIFKEKFDSYVFLDSKGNEYAAVVEFAPFSRIPKKRNKRPDPKCGTIESDPVYTEFIESLNEVTTENEEKPEYCFQPSVDDKKEITNTPLLDYVKQRRIDRQKMKEEKREERKRKELERKRVKEDERKVREKSYGSSVRKLPFKSTSLNVIDEAKSDSKLKDRKPDEYKNKTVKSSNFREREYSEKKTYISSKSIHSTIDRKPLPKMRQRSTNYQEKEPRRSEYKSMRKEDTKYRKDEPDEKVMEKKVKKYSERREERKNEIRKTESKSDADCTKEDKNETKGEEDKRETKGEEDKSETNKEFTKDNKEYDKKNETRENARSRDSESRESTRSRDNESREGTRSREHDPRTQRRIRNKDRPAMQIYQPGMLKNRNKCSDTNQDEKNSFNEEDQKTD